MTPAQYRRILLDARKTQLKLSLENVRRLERVFDQAAENLAEIVMSAGAESMKAEFSYALLQDMDRTLTALREDYHSMLGITMGEAAQGAADRESAITQALGVLPGTGMAAEQTVSVLLSDGAKVSAQLGLVALRAVDMAARRVYSDGYALSDRLARLDQAGREVVQATIVQGVAEQIPAKELASRLQSAFSAAGEETPRWQAMRIARTEINTAHREAHIQSTLDDSGKLKEFIQGIRWNLSLSHREADICDVWAAGSSEGLPDGVYLPEDVPSDHPFGLCFTTTELADFPGESVGGSKPDPAGAPESEVRYYAEKLDDGAAKAWIAERA